MSQRIEALVKAEKKLNPNVDFYSASTYYALGIPIDLFTPIFAVSRVSGWTAHVLEQYANNRLIRPRADYIGPRVPADVPAARAAIEHDSRGRTAIQMRGLSNATGSRRGGGENSCLACRPAVLRVSLSQALSLESTRPKDVSPPPLLLLPFDSSAARQRLSSRDYVFKSR